ncbi:hypothetical protein ACFIOZ_07300 [Vreelandella sp. F11]|uniref:hypothetical protein n=1 Tax=Vreelandella sp. F11 TaxID=3394751 RepID=UPI0036D9FAEE
MSEHPAPLLLHIGPLRKESKKVLQQSKTPALVVCPPHSTAEYIPLKNSARFATAWVTPLGNEQSCYRYSLEDFNSLAEAKSLKELYPGVTLQQCRTVETHAVGDLLKEQGLEDSSVTGLIIEQADQAMPLLKKLKEQGLLATLSHLWVRTSSICLYVDMPVQSELVKWCEEEGFEPVKEDAEDPEFSLQAFKRNRLHGVLKKTQQQSNEHKKKFEAMSQERDALSKTLEASKKEVARAKEERETLSKEIQVLRQKNQQLTNESSETQQKQRQLEIELERAEAQLELIKELLLKDKLLSS